MESISTSVRGDLSGASAAFPSIPSSPALPNFEQRSDSIANAEKEKKSAWNTVIPNATSNAGSVMGAASWPALSAVRDAISSLDSIPDLKDCVVPIVSSQVSDNASSQNPGSSNYVRPVRRKFNSNSNMMRGSGTGVGSNNGGSGNSSGIGSDLLALPVLPSAGLDNGPEFLNRDLSNNVSSNWDLNQAVDFGMRPHNGPYGGSRRGNSGSVGSFHGGHGSRREHERGGNYWHAPRGFNARDPQMPLPVHQLRGHSRPFIQQLPPQPAQVHFFSEPGQVRPYLSPLPFPEMHSGFYYGPTQAPPLEPLRNVPYFPPQIPAAMPPMIHSSLDQEKQAKLLKQIEFYFSPDNLCKDTFLRKNMDDEGWVPVSLIANFNRVRQITNNTDYILDTLRASTKVEVQAHKVRKRNDWMIWILPHQITYSSPMSDYNALVAGISNVSFEQASRQ